MFLQVLLLPFYLGTISEASLKSPLGNVTESSNSSEPFSLVPTIEHAPYATSPFSFFIPYNQTQSCDIYGPICQTGSITVAVSLDNTKSTSTTLPCSSYLTAQSAYLDAFNNPQQPGANFPFWPPAWQINFGRSPECSSYAHAFDRKDQLTLSGCGVNNKVTPAFQGGGLPSQLPPGVLRHHEFLRYQCCGNCSLDVPEVRLFYFPDPNAASYCANRRGVSASANYTTKAINERAYSTPRIEVTATLSGQTFTSPSVYLQLVGEVSLTDQCDTNGFGGPTLTDPFVAIPSGQLSTYEYPQFTKGQQWADPNGVIGAMFVGEANPLNVADLACPTFGLGIGSRSGRPYTTVGPPYLPLIIPPPQVLSLDPQWQKACKGFLSYAPGLLSFAIFDPPRTLTPATALLPDPTRTPENTPATLTTSAESAHTTPIQPAQIPSSDLPDPTGNPDAVLDPQKPPLGDPKTASHISAEPNNEPAAQMSALHQVLDPAPPESLQAKPAPQPSNAAPAGDSDTQPKDPAVATSAVVDPKASVHYPVDTSVPLGQNPDARPLGSLGGFNAPVVASADQYRPNPDPASDTYSVGAPYGGDPAIDPHAEPGDAPQEAPQGLGRLILNALGGAAPSEHPSPPVFTVAGQTFTANPTGFSVAGSQVLPGHAPLAISGTPIWLDPSGVLVVGSSTTRLLAPTLDSNIETPPVFTFADRTFTVDSTGLQVGGSQVLPDHAPVTLSGTPISLDSSGALFVGSLSTQLPAPTTNPIIGIVGGQTFTAKPTGFVLAGTSLQPGGQGVTISGTPISLAPSGVLVIGSSTMQLSTPTSALDVATIGGQIFTANPTGFQIAGTSILPGGQAVTISGTPVSLDPSGILHVGSSSFTIPSIPTQSSGVVTLGGLAFTALSPSAVVIDGTTLSAGDQAITVDGSRVSLGVGGDLVVGSVTTQVPTVASGMLAFEGNAGRRFKLPSLLQCRGFLMIEVVFALLWIA